MINDVDVNSITIPSIIQIIEFLSNLLIKSMDISNKLNVDLIKKIEEWERSFIQIYVLKDILSNLIGLPIVKIEYRSDRSCIIAVVDGNARNVLECWLGIVDKIKDMPIFFDWIGETDVSPEELGKYLGKIFSKMGLFLSTKEEFNAIELLREEWK
jgi:hypothetical protein